MQILAIDVGVGTQDLLLYDSDERIENCIKMVLPTQTKIVAKKIAETTHEGKDIFLTGGTMGGGPSTKAVKDHIGAGLNVYATESAALTLYDNLQKVKDLGVKIVDEAPKNVTRIETRDVDIDAIKRILSMFDVEVPKKVAIAVQDHGYSPRMSNRIFRFQHIKKFMEMGGNLSSFVYVYKDNLPPYLTRMEAVAKSLRGYDVALTDTGIAAIWGALTDPPIMEKDPVILINVGNGHTLGALMSGKTIAGLFEHHTHCMNAEKLDEYIVKLGEGTLTFDEIFDDGGHGCFINDAPGFDEVELIAVTGPRRSMARDSKLDLYFAAPHGDMMMTGCFGLVEAYKHKFGGC
ncbi:MAG: DUF1786 domain-containing protein [Methanocellales archaeon]|nr:DUF1786 domain-containing protein [Methanocellales archaeon]MDD3291942.1 DUF1786 domain-containing protein [Methanocellales archaeon]MDD5235657.1 DUF1786 domain-containing protein [Methanocellales archaeon]MDD5485504.1 DUF1786 domain-containing protein [Methanocellales archaeon]